MNTTNYKRMNFPVSYNYLEKFHKDNPNTILKIYGAKGASKHTTKKELHQKMFPQYFETLTPAELKGNKVIYILCLFPDEEVVADRFNKNN